MNDWTAEQANGYEAYMAQLGAEVHRQFQLARKITVGSKILFFNHAAQADTWATVEKFNFSDFTNTHAVVKGGRMVFLKEIKIVHNEDATETVAILLNDRVTEILEACVRFAGNQFETTVGPEKNSFYVLNRTKETQYLVSIDTDAEQNATATCTCPDFIHRSRVCKHIIAVLDRWFQPLFAQIVRRDVSELSENDVFEAGYSLSGGASLEEVAADLRVDAEDLRDILLTRNAGAYECADCGEWSQFTERKTCCLGEVVRPKLTGDEVVAPAVELTYERYEREVVANRRDEIGETMDCGCERFRDGHIDRCYHDWLRHNEPETDEIFF